MFSGIFMLKHKASFGKYENLSKIFFAEMLVFDHDYEGKSSSSNGLLWISFFFIFLFIWIIFRIHVNYTLQGAIIIKSLI